MSRIRTIKPEFWTSEQIVECSTTARLLFIGMWNFSDDGGNLPASAKTLKMQIFPADSIDPQPLVDELKAAGLVQEYIVDAKKYWNITGWKHQKIEKPTFKHPKPEAGKFVEASPTPRLVLVEPSAPESKGVESKGRDVGEARKRAYRLPEDWVLPAEYRLAAKERGLSDAEIDHQAERMLHWSRSDPKGAKIDWFHTWMNWIDGSRRGGQNKLNRRVAAI